MKFPRFLVAVIAVTFSNTIYGQVQVSTETTTGFESNIFKAPNSLFSEDTDVLMQREALVTESLYQDALFKFSYRFKDRNYDFKFSMNPEFRYYFDAPNAKRLLLNSRANYTMKLKRRLEWESDVHFKLRDQKGQDLDQNELNTTLGYRQLNAFSGLNFRWYKNNRSFVRLEYRFKDFYNSNTRSIAYHRYGISTGFRHLDWKDGLLHSVGIEAGFYHRSYDIVSRATGQTSDRVWQYLNVALSYKLPLSQHWNLTTGFAYEKRMDRTNDEFGYNQFRSSIKLQYKAEKLNLRLTSSYSLRKFNELVAENSEENEVGLLKYDYLRLRFLGSYQLNNNWSIIANGYLIDRASNNTNVNTTAFRAYNSYYAGIGIRYTF
ncbi:hypothetical protein [uncultured Kordia sp.]|uniref:hypothetical protein n=1 Tax=uncultured Kordia sp. TaxID=507699 RepID=UPI0026372898|nr:hypothetical protein [uncultured Kordia sp.]